MFARNGRAPAKRYRSPTGAARLLGLLTVLMFGLVGSAAAADGLRFSLIKTAQSDTRSEYSWRRGGWQQSPPVNHLAILIEHGRTRLLFGTGLGRQIDAQVDAEVPWRSKHYGEVHAVRDQLERDGLTVDRILLGCVRWEHASGLADYPEVPVAASADSLRYLRAATPPAVLPSQFRHAVRWQTLQFESGPYLGYARSLDLFGDGALVLVAAGRARRARGVPDVGRRSPVLRSGATVNPRSDLRRQRPLQRWRTVLRRPRWASIHAGSSEGGAP